MAPIPTTTTSPEAMISKQERLLDFWAIIVAAYLLLAIVLFFCTTWLQGKQQRELSKRKELDKFQAVGQRTAAAKQGVPTTITMKGKKETAKSIRPSTPTIVPSEQKMLPTTVSSKRRPEKFFIHEDVTQELTLSLRSASDKDYIQTAHDYSAKNPIQIMTPPDSYSGSETVPQTETISRTQEGTGRSTRSSSSRSVSTTSSTSGSTASSISDSSTLTSSSTSASSSSLTNGSPSSTTTGSSSSTESSSRRSRTWIN